jgi:hypothetical protein
MLGITYKIPTIYLVTLPNNLILAAQPLVDTFYPLLK